MTTSPSGADPSLLRTFTTPNALDYKDLQWMVAHLLKLMGGSISFSREELESMAGVVPPVIFLEEVRGPLGYDKVVVLRLKDGSE